MPPTLTVLIEKQKTKLCVDCRWYLDGKCQEPRARYVDPVNGDIHQYDAAVMRHAPMTGCDTEARWFQPGEDGMACQGTGRANQ